MEVDFQPASGSDLTVLWKMELDLPENSTLYADGAYNCYDLEDILRDGDHIQLMARRKHPHSKRLRTMDVEKFISSRRQIVETAFSVITAMLPRYVRAHTEKGFIVRIMSAILAYSMSFFSK